jgi:putative transferase (TIGR04331 family)
MGKRCLVTTSDQRTWPKDITKTIVFLGEGCKLYSQKYKWKGLDSKVIPYHWDNREKLHQDFLYLDTVYEKALRQLANNLNKIHNVNYSLKYWRVLIGPWLMHFIHLLFDRWSMLNLAFSNNEIYNYSIIKHPSLSFVPNDMSNFSALYYQDDWNETIYGELVTLCWSDKVEITWVDGENGNSKEGVKINVKGRMKGHAKNLAKSLVSLYSQCVSKDDDYFFLSSYLPLKIDLKLQLQLGQMPAIWNNSLVCPVEKRDGKKRQWSLDLEVNNDFEHALQTMIPLHIPVIYLEGYKALHKSAEKSPWPSNPKAIFTSNAHSGNEIFKAWSAKKMESGVPLVIGQHGGNYGNALFSAYEMHEVKIADRWFSWGWSDPDRLNIKPIGNLKAISEKVNYNPKGKALMVEWNTSLYSNRIHPGPIAAQWLDYFNEQKVFLASLPTRIREQVVLRLYPIDFGWEQGVRWQDAMPRVAIDSGGEKITKSIRNSRIYISTYNATTYLESLTWNVPTLIFWDPRYFELRGQAEPYFDMLESVGIFHKTPKSAAQQMIKVWGDIESWWQSDEVQRVREIFINQYSATSDKTFELLRDELVEVANETTKKEL